MIKAINSTGIQQSVMREDTRSTVAYPPSGDMQKTPCRSAPSRRRGVMARLFLDSALAAAMVSLFGAQLLQAVCDTAPLLEHVDGLQDLAQTYDVGLATLGDFHTNTLARPVLFRAGLIARFDADLRAALRSVELLTKLLAQAICLA